MVISNILNELRAWAPETLQESYDNSGLLVGDENLECTGVLVCLDAIEDVIEEAIAKNCNLVVAHHPIVFSGLKRFTGSNYIQRTIMKAIKHDIAIYAIHTNLDNVMDGVNGKMADLLGLKERSILAPNGALYKIKVFVPQANIESFRKALLDLNYGKIGNYSHCSFASEGEGTFHPLEGANPVIGKVGELAKVNEASLEFIVKAHELNKAVKDLKELHPYEEVAYDILALHQKDKTIGAGIIGDLPKDLKKNDFLNLVKKSFNLQAYKFVDTKEDKPIKKVALCGGSGSFLLNDAMKSKADVFITSDFKYHQFFDTEGEILLLDIGHFESERYTIELIVEYLTKKFINFAVCKTEIITNPVKIFN